MSDHSSQNLEDLIAEREALRVIRHRQPNAKSLIADINEEIESRSFYWAPDFI